MKNTNSKGALKLVRSNSKPPRTQPDTTKTDDMFDIIESSRSLKNLVSELPSDIGDQIWRLADAIQLKAEANA